MSQLMNIKPALTIRGSDNSRQRQFGAAAIRGSHSGNFRFSSFRIQQLRTYALIVFCLYMVNVMT